MNWLFVILRLLMGWPALDSSDPHVVAVCPDGRTAVLPATMIPVRWGTNRRWDWLLPRFFRRVADFGFPCVVDESAGRVPWNLPGESARRARTDRQR